MSRFQRCTAMIILLIFNFQLASNKTKQNKTVVFAFRIASDS